MSTYVTVIEISGEYEDKVEANSLEEAKSLAVRRYNNLSSEDIDALLGHVYAEDVYAYKLGKQQ